MTTDDWHHLFSVTIHELSLKDFVKWSHPTNLSYNLVPSHPVPVVFSWMAISVMLAFNKMIVNAVSTEQCANKMSFGQVFFTKMRRSSKNHWKEIFKFSIIPLLLDFANLTIFLQKRKKIKNCFFFSKTIKFNEILKWALRPL